MVSGLIEKLNGRGRLLTIGEKCREEIKRRWPSTEDHEWRLNVYPDLIESTALVLADTFLGTYFSTYSQIAAVRSSALGNRAFFMQTRLQRALWDNRGELILFALVIVLYIVVRWLRVSRGRSYASVLYIRLLRLNKPNYCLRDSSEITVV